MKHKLSDVIEFNSNFKTSVNLYLDLYRTEKVKEYIPTKSSMEILGDYIGAVADNKDNSTILIGPYGKGKSHLLLVLLSVLSLDDTAENNRTISELTANLEKTGDTGRSVSEKIKKLRRTGKRYLPVLIQNPGNDLQGAFIYALYEALGVAGLKYIVPDTAYKIAADRINEWKKKFKSAYEDFCTIIRKHGYTIKTLNQGLKEFSKEALKVFTDAYPVVTSGSIFNPLVTSDVFSLYRSICDKLVNEFGYGGIYIVFDEFSKFIESQNENTGSNMRLIQDICELANNSKNGELFFTMVAHKSIKEYGKHLSAEIINSFTGIEGRIKERLFVTSAKNNYELIMHAINKKDSISEDDDYKTFVNRTDDYYSFLPFYSSSFEKKDFKEMIMEGCYPLNPVTSYLLLNISEKIAQNERTLFTFIANDEAGSLARYVKNQSEDQYAIIGADLIYDYFRNLLKNEVMNERIHNIWLDAEYALSKCKSNEQKKIVKIIACFFIANKEELTTNESIIDAANSFDNTKEILDELRNNKIIYFREISSTYHFKTRAGSSLKKEIKKMRAVWKQENYSKVFEEVMQDRFIVPKKYNSDHMMTRYFKHEYISVGEFMSINDSNAFFGSGFEGDGLVLSLFRINGKDDSEYKEIREHFLKLSDNKLIVVCPAKKLSFNNQIIDYEIIREIRQSGFLTANEENEAAAREIPIMVDDLETDIRKKLMEVYLDDSRCTVISLSDGETEEVPYSELENAVGLRCDDIYCRTPVINNEIINRKEINTAPTRKARNVIISNILNQNAGENFYKGTSQEATIYRSLIKNTFVDNRAGSRNENDRYLWEIIDETDRFIDQCAGEKRSLDSYIAKLTKEPYGMRNAVIPVYLAYVLAKRKEDIVIYFGNTEMQLTTDIVVNMCEHPEDYSLFISKESAEKEKYIKDLNAMFDVSEQRNLSENRIKNIVICMQRWFRALPQISRTVSEAEKYAELKKIDLKKLMGFITSLQKIEVNPYELLFRELPLLLDEEVAGNGTIRKLKVIKESFEEYFSWMLKQAIDATRKIFNVKKQEDLYHALKAWYESQGDVAKNSILDGHATNLMSCIVKLDKYDDEEVVKRLIKSVTDIYVDNWTGGALENYVNVLGECKNTVEKVNQSENTGKNKIVFSDADGKEHLYYYDNLSDSSGDILKNVIEDALNDYDDMSVNDRVAILVEMLKKIIG
ncbi:MAG: hypothetical protein J6M24_07515 [Lachnospiraceae bacterium]|nr:hypothetical protein [Lachnospiraceae bacterium]